MTDTLSTLTLSPTQMSILEKGMTYGLFTLTQQQRGKAASVLITKGLIRSQKKGVYTLTKEGRAAYEQARPSVDTFTVSTAINTDDAALTVEPVVELSEKRLKRIKHLEKTVDDLNALLDQRDSTIESLRRQIDQLKDALKARR